MKMLIIFFIIIFIFNLILFLGKIKVKIFLKVLNNDVCIILDILGKTYKSESKILSIKNKKSNKTYDEQIKLAKSLIKKSEVEKIDINVKYGTIFNLLNIYLTALFSTLIPIIFMLPFKRKENLNFKVVPNFNEFLLNLTLDAEVKFKIYHFILILIMFKKGVISGGGSSNKKAYG